MANLGGEANYENGAFIPVERWPSFRPRGHPCRWYFPRSTFPPRVPPAVARPPSPQQSRISAHAIRLPLPAPGCSLLATYSRRGRIGRRLRPLAGCLRRPSAPFNLPWCAPPPVLHSSILSSHEIAPRVEPSSTPTSTPTTTRARSRYTRDSIATATVPCRIVAPT